MPTKNERESPDGDEDYKVGPGRPPREYQFKPGQSGNPSGFKRKPRSLVPDVKALLSGALSQTVRLKQGERKQTVTMLAAGIEQLVAQFAKGDRHARRDIFWLADKLGVNLIGGGNEVTDETTIANREAILRAYVNRQYDKVVQPAPVFAPPELLDDDPEE